MAHEYKHDVNYYQEKEYQCNPVKQAIFHVSSIMSKSVEFLTQYRRSIVLRLLMSKSVEFPQN
jgi:hypothetical protein